MIAREVLPLPETVPKAARTRNAAPRPGRIAQVCGVGVSLIGLVVLLGWLVDSAAIKSVLPGLAEMKANTALCFLLIGTALWAPASPGGESRYSPAAAGFVIILGLATAFEYLGGPDLGIDELLFRDPVGPERWALPAGRMAFASAAAFVMAGGSLLLLRRRAAVAQFLACATAWTALFSVAGYLCRDVGITGVSPFTSLALHTAFGFSALAVGLLAASPPSGPIAVLMSATRSGALARKLLPSALGVTLGLGALGAAGQRTGWCGPVYGMAIFALTNATVLGGVIWYVAHLAFLSELAAQESGDQVCRLNEALERRVEARTGELRDTLESVKDRQSTITRSNERIEALEQRARDLAWVVETTRQRTLLQSDEKIEALEQKARDLANFVEALRSQTRQQSDTEIEHLGQQARDLALSVEAVRKETRLKSEAEIATLERRARELAVSVKTVREETLLQSGTEIEALNQQARNLAASVERSRIETLMESEKVTRKLNEQLEHRVLERTSQLEAANKELESFSYSVSHDLRAPLRAIAGFSRIVLEDHAGALPDPAKAYLKLVCENTRTMGQLVDDLLAFSRLGRQGLTKHAVQTDKIVRQCLGEMQKEREGREVEIVIGEFPPCQADPTLLKQVWTNLLSNALKYTRKRPAARIEIGCRTGQRPSGSGEETVYFVKDDGAGFDMKYAHKLFGVFQRLHRAADYDGTGVGLAIVQRIVCRHGGRVWGEARPNQGATFSFTLE